MNAKRPKPARRLRNIGAAASVSGVHTVSAGVSSAELGLGVKRFDFGALRSAYNQWRHRNRAYSDTHVTGIADARYCIVHQSR